MPELAKNGIRLQVNRAGSVVTFQVLEQSKEATQALRLLGHVRDEATGLSLRSNKGPSYNSKVKRFFIRGSKKDEWGKVVRAEFKTTREAEEAIAALDRLLDQVVMPEMSEPDQHHIDIGSARIMKGGTTHVRMMFIDKSMADELVVTGHKHYSAELPEWVPSEPVVTNNRHYNEHIGQIVDVLNKSVARDVKVEANVINHHRVTAKQARQAVELQRSAFRQAQEGGFLVAYWRVVTGLRGPDHEN